MTINKLFRPLSLAILFATLIFPLAAVHGESAQAVFNKTAKEHSLYTPTAEYHLWTAYESGNWATVKKVFQNAAKSEEGARNAQLQANLGTLILWDLNFGSHSDQEKYDLSLKAIKHFDKATKLDEKNFDAWLGKAIVYSYWPAGSSEVSGAEKIFRTLIEMQNAQPSSSPEFAKTWLHYGELHEFHGRKDQALKIWREGSELFPNSDELKEKLK